MILIMAREGTKELAIMEDHPIHHSFKPLIRYRGSKMQEDGWCATSSDIGTLINRKSWLSKTAVDVHSYVISHLHSRLIKVVIIYYMKRDQSGSGFITVGTMIVCSVFRIGL